MNTVIVILLIWLIVFLHFVWLDIKPWELMRDRKIQKQPQVRSPETEIGKGSDFIGRSHVKIIVNETNAANIAPKAPRTEEGEDVDAKDVTFAPSKREKMLRQMTPEEEEEAFRNFTYSKEEQIDEDEYAVVAGVRVDDNCNYTGFYCETFCYKEWNKMAHDPKDWPGRTIKSAMLDPMGVADMDEYDKEYNSPTSLFYDLLHAYGFENLFTNAWGYEEFTLAEVLACIESDNKKINEKKAA
jgi:hypothetical protein